MSNKKVTFVKGKSEDITQWYTDVCLKAELMSYAKTKGFIIYRPDGYALWENIQDYLNSKIKRLGVRNVYLPCLIPTSLLNKEKEHVVGFAPECAYVTKGGNKQLSEEMVVRPTSETLFCDHFKDIVHSYNDLPIKYNQWCSVVRWEKTTRPFLRGSEFLWQEGHTLHQSKDEAREFALSILRLYNEMGRDLLALPFVMGRKTDSEKFAGAEDTYTIEAMMPDGQALQCGTSHYLGTGFCKAYGIKYSNKDNQIEYPHYTSWGVSTRLLGALIMVHGDDEGLVLPPKIAPIQAVIIPIRAEGNPEVTKACKELTNRLEEEGIRVKLDDSDKTPGWKFAQYEMKGIPVRIEIGPKDLEKGQVCLTKRYDSSKEFISIDEVVNTLPNVLEEIHKGMYNKALDILESHTYTCHNRDEISDVLSNQKGFAKVMVNTEDEEFIEGEMRRLFSATPRCMPFDQRPFQDTDSFTGKEGASRVVIFARAY